MCSFHDILSLNVICAVVQNTYQEDGSSHCIEKLYGMDWKQQLFDINPYWDHFY